jgi:hypothetical protein
MDGVLLVDPWSQLVLPRAVRAAWQPLIDATLATEHIAAEPALGFASSRDRERLIRSCRVTD